jgi:glycosyltransferase involved in cell wall biosynthesis
MKKILILIDQFYEYGGIEKLVSLKANYWSKNFSYDVTLVCTENKGKPFAYELDPSVDFIDLEINYNRSISYFSLKNMLLLLKNIIKLQIYIMRENPDFIVVASHIPITYCLPFLKLGKTKIIKEFHFTQYYRKKSKSLKKFIFNFIESRYNKLIVLSHEEANYYNTNNVEVIANPIENKLVLVRPIEKQKIALAVVRFAPVKRLELMVSAWKIFIDKGNKDWKLHIYGDYNNEYGIKIKNLVKHLKLYNYIIFNGRSDRVLEEVSKSKVLLLTSSQECFPMVILEAQSVGTPVISFDCPTGPRNIINDNKNGILVENNNIELFAEKLNTFASDTDMQERLSKNALINAEKYSIDKIMDRWRSKVFV